MIAIPLIAVVAVVAALVLAVTFQRVAAANRRRANKNR